MQQQLDSRHGLSGSLAAGSGLSGSLGHHHRCVVHQEARGLVLCRYRLRGTDVVCVQHASSGCILRNHMVQWASER